MTRSPSLLLMLILLLDTEVCQCEDVLVVARMSSDEVNDIPESPEDLTMSREQILSAQFECYLKIMYEPPRRDPGPYCNRTWDGWLCWGDSAPGTASQQCPSYYLDFDPSEKVTKVCDSDGQWFRHPESHRIWSNYTQCSAYNNQKLKFQIGCKILATLIQYTSCSNFFWMLCEGIYLHTLIIVAVFVGEQQLGWYYVLGWGFPVIPAVMYAVARLLFFDDRCWVMNTDLLYITHGPIHVALLVNLFFLLNIVRVLITKLRVTHQTESSVYMKAVRATIILIPLLGAQFILMPLQPSGRLSLAMYDLFMNSFMHFQGFLVAVIFCFCNGEVQSALRRKFAQYRGQWRRRRLVTTDSHCNYHTNSSITETSRVNISLEHGSSNTHTLNGQSNGKPCPDPEPLEVLQSTEI
ncbi:unnamed protein product [Leuciscus chuanchicus]